MKDKTYRQVQKEKNLAFMRKRGRKRRLAKAENTPQKLRNLAKVMRDTALGLQEHTSNT